MKRSTNVFPDMHDHTAGVDMGPEDMAEDTILDYEDTGVGRQDLAGDGAGADTAVVTGVNAIQHVLTMWYLITVNESLVFLTDIQISLKHAKLFDSFVSSKFYWSLHA